MAKLASLFSFLIAVAMQTTDATVVCDAGYEAKTGVGVGELSCPGITVDSCKTSTTCCTPLETCGSATISCDSGTYNKGDATLTGGATTAKQNCCVPVATCADYAGSCSSMHGYAANTVTAAEKCPGAVETCMKNVCCILDTTSCKAWLQTNTCGAGKVPIRTGTTIGNDISTCCIDAKKCSSHTCLRRVLDPSGVAESLTHELKDSPSTIDCPFGECSDGLCCKYKSQYCGGQAGTGCSDQTRLPDVAKNDNLWNQEYDLNCCSYKASCKDTAAVATSEAAVPVPAFVIMASLFFFVFAKH